MTDEEYLLKKLTKKCIKSETKCIAVTYKTNINLLQI